MRAFTFAAGLLGLLSSVAASDAAAPTSSSYSQSKVSLPTTFKPPQVFKNANLVHIVSLEKNYVKEQLNVLVENIDKESQDEYFLPFTADQMSHIGGFEVKDRKKDDAGPFAVQAVEFDPTR